jgi:hypothetical protein
MSKGEAETDPHPLCLPLPLKEGGSYSEFFHFLLPLSLALLNIY